MTSLVATYFGDDEIVLPIHVTTWLTVGGRRAPMCVRTYSCMLRVKSR